MPKLQKYKIPVNGWAKRIAAGGTGQYYTDMTVEGTDIRVLATGIGLAGALLVALPLTDVNHALRDQLLLLMLIAAGGYSWRPCWGCWWRARRSRRSPASRARPRRSRQPRAAWRNSG